MPTLEEVKHRTTPVGKIIGVIEYLEENGGGGAGGSVADKPEIATLEQIADPSTANAETVATLLNAVIAALKA